MSRFAFVLGTLRRRAIVVAFGAASVNAAMVVVACSSSGDAAGTDQDASVEGGASLPDARTDAPTTKPDSGKTGNCTAVKGPCDLVVQDCPNDAKGNAQECVVTGSGTSYTTTCVPVQASQTLPMGRACCPPTQDAPQNPCLPGLTCVGQPCQDGGPPTGRCTPACCKGDDQSCGKSDPEGIAGACDIALFDTKTDTELHNVCSYRERCKPFGVEPCKPGQLCLVEDKLGSASCLTSFGKQNGEPCKFANDCADGLICVGSGDAGACRWMCVTPNSIPPFDASADDPVGHGGCPAGEGCNITFDKDTAPGWLSACSDGG